MINLNVSKFRFFLFIIFLSLSVRSQDAAQYIGPNRLNAQVKGMITAVWSHSLNPDFVLAGSATGGLFKCENATDSIPHWQCITDPFDGPVMGISDIVVKSGTNNKELFISTCSKSALSKAYGNGILHSDDGGKKWKHVGPGNTEDFNFSLNGLVMNPENENEMLAYDSHSVYFTSDNWKSHKVIDLNLNKNDRDVSLCDVEFAPFENGKFYACTRTNNKYEAKVFVIENYGSKVIDRSPANVKSERFEISTIQDPHYKGRFYVALGWIHVYVQYFNGSDYSGNLNAKPVNQVYAGAYWNFELSVNQKDTNVMYLSMTETSRSLDGGKTFQHLSIYNGLNTHADNRAQILIQHSLKGMNDRLILGNDGGVSVGLSSNEQFNWRNLNGTGLNVNQFWGISVLQSDSLFLAGGTADNGGFIFWKGQEINSMGACGDGYLTQVVGKDEAIVQCNTPSILYHDLKNKRSVYLNVTDARFDGKRPMCMHDSFVYVGYINCWRISQRELMAGKTNFTQFSNIPDIKNRTGGIRNGALKAMKIGPLNEGLMAYKDPNWGDVENNGKFFHCMDLKKNIWNDITNEAVCNGFAICQWSEINVVEFDGKTPNKFYLVSRDVNDQSNSRLFSMQFVSDSGKYALKEIGKGLPKAGINDICIDRFSRVMYLATDVGIYYSDMNSDSLQWNLYGSDYFPTRAMVFDLEINQVNNKMYAGTFGRGIWSFQLISMGNENKFFRKNTSIQSTTKLDGKISVGRKRKLIIDSKLIISTKTRIHLKRNAQLIVANKDLIRNEANEFVDVERFIKKEKHAKVLIQK